jgi:tRNA threonylcarbamoyladenosine biosynthesis protein TsaB
MTAPLLVIDASTYRGTAAIIVADRVVGSIEAQMRGADEERLMPAVASLLRDAGIATGALGGVVCGEGPGSFTSLRIAASIAKGIVSATGVPLMIVSSLALIVAGAAPAVGTGRYLALIDAMRGEWFAARVVVDGSGAPLLEGPHELVNSDLLRRIAHEEHRVAIGPGQTIDASPHARGVARLAGSPAMLRTVDAATWEPTYGRLAEAQAQWERTHGRPLVA